MRSTLLVLASIISATLSVSAGIQRADTDFRLNVATRTNGDTVDVELTNLATKTAVAWSLKFQRLAPDGRPDGGAISQDLYPLLIIPGKGGVGPLAPNRPSVVLSLPASAYAGATFEVIAVVYEDGTSVGDEDRIGRFFKQRKADADGWKEMTAALNRLERTRITPGSVQSVMEQFDANPQQDTGQRRLVVGNLERLLKSPATLESGLKDLISMAGKYAEGSAAQAIRR